MKIEDYTADAICRAMALPGFIEEAWTEPRVSALRVVLTPSFDSELCITLVEKSGDASLAVRALEQQLWAHGAPRTIMPIHGGDGAFGYGLFQESRDLFALAHDAAKSFQGLCIDGMGMDACLVTGGVVSSFEINAGSGGAPAELARKLIDWSWTLIEDPFVRNALASCAKYVGREYTMKKVPQPKPVTRLAVLGAPGDREEYLQKLRSVRPGGSRASLTRR